MDINEAKARHAAGKAIRTFAERVAAKRDLGAFNILPPYSDLVGDIFVTDIALRLDATEAGETNPIVHLTATIAANRTRSADHLTDEDVERVARAAYAEGRTEATEFNFGEAVTAQPTPDLYEVSRDIETILGWTTPELDFRVRVAIGDWTEDVMVLGLNTWGLSVEEAPFASRVQARLDALHSDRQNDFIL